MRETLHHKTSPGLTMNLNSLPLITYSLAITIHREILTFAAQQILGTDGDARFWGFAPIEHSFRSGRVFFLQSHESGVRVEGGLTAAQLADELIRFSKKDARYATDNRRDEVKAWELRHGRMDGRDVLIVFAGWL